ncbi:MAG: polysaccharide biosynthesis protein [Bacilli bacterium]|nr:polysaccharide biosynthesis protein [Bacilli bacterium]
MKRKIWIKLLYVLVDAVLAFGFGLFTFRYSGVLGFSSFTQTQQIGILVYSGVLAALHIIMFFVFKVYNILSANFSIGDALKVVIISFVISIVSLPAIIFIPDKILFFQWQLLFSWGIATVMIAILMVAERFAPRLLTLFHKMQGASKPIRTLVIGAGSVGKIVIDECRFNKENKHNVVVMVDDDPNKIGGIFSNIPVKGPINNIKTIIDYYQIEEVIIAIANLKEDRLHEILELLSSSNVRIKRMPLLTEMQGPNDRRMIDVDLDDLLCRDPIILDNSEINNMLNGKTVLVTGAGGSIGSELVRQIFKTHPKTLVLFDIYENSTYDIQMELVRKMRELNIKDIELVTLIGSTYNEIRVEQIFKKYKPDYIYHAAAYKHVPLMEDSPAEAIRTNVIGTYNVAKMADKYAAKKMVLVSTDKAVRPTNVMGATKRFAEMIIQHFAAESKNTAYAAVRFGNVLGSNGSVVPLFKKQIEAGGPVTITDKRIIRYFMTIPEAVSLILQCGLFATGGEIFILDMGKPVRILDLAEKLIRQAGLVPDVDIKIIETGLRPGEKLYEELLLDSTNQTKTSNSRIYVEEKESIKPIKEEILTISKAFELENNSDVKSLLASVIDTYKITENR